MTDLKGMRHPGSKLQIHLVFCSFSFIKKKIFIQSKAQIYTGEWNGSHSFGKYVNGRGAMGSNLQIND